MLNVLDTIDQDSMSVSDGSQEPHFINYTDYSLILDELKAISLQLQNIQFVVHDLRTKSATEHSTHKIYTETVA